jgi:hypothetical protein
MNGCSGDQGKRGVGLGPQDAGALELGYRGVVQAHAPEHLARALAQRGSACLSRAAVLLEGKA